MKLSEISSNKMMDVLCDLVVPIATIAEDRQILEAFFERVTVDEGMSYKERKVLGIMQVAQNFKIIIPGLLRNHRNDVYEILSIINEKEIEEIKNQSPIETVKQVKELLEDEEFTSFFSSQLNSNQKQSSTSTSSEEVVE